jgi:hypothetical protein
VLGIRRALDGARVPLWKNKLVTLTRKSKKQSEIFLHKKSQLFPIFILENFDEGFSAPKGLF